jgi:hypothetical protein
MPKIFLFPSLSMLLLEVRPTGTPRYFTSNLIASCAQPDTGGPFDELSGR